MCEWVNKYATSAVFLFSLWDRTVAGEEHAEQDIPEHANAQKVHEEVDCTPDEHEFLHPDADFEHLSDQWRCGREVGQCIIERKDASPWNYEHLL